MKLKKAIKKKLRAFGKKPAVLNFIGGLAFCYTWLVGKTSRFENADLLYVFEDLIEKNDGAIFVTWHGRALMLPFFWHNYRQMKALVSPHNDGRIIAKLLRGYKISSIDGSSNERAFSSALEIVKELQKGTVVSLIPDGPRGPSMRLNKSVIYFAQKSGKPIMGFTYSAKNAYIVEKSWDSMLIPYPFTKGCIKATKPLYVPQDATEEELEQIRLNFETELNNLTFELDKKYGLPEIPAGKTPKPKRH